MVCEKCEKKGKIGKVIVPDPWKAGSRNNTEGGGRKVNENKLLSSSKNRFSPTTSIFKKCRICKSKIHVKGAHYCQECAYKKGICSMCGTKILKTKNYKQTSV
ncbi:cysteine-rich PDZ-binding protein [Lepeophtheirus salmonis]|nr:cysteine-rich PDZ-binding protein-like [Lepeophtheirus salmonis]